MGVTVIDYNQPQWLAEFNRRGERIAELEAERDRLREALKEIAKFADSEYRKRIPAPSCVEFSTIKRYAEKALGGAGREGVRHD